MNKNQNNNIREIEQVMIKQQTIWLINQPTNQPTNHPTDQPTNRPTNQRTNQPTNKPTNLLTNQPTNRLSNNWKYQKFDFDWQFFTSYEYFYFKFPHKTTYLPQYSKKNVQMSKIQRNKSFKERGNINPCKTMLSQEQYR